MGKSLKGKELGTGISQRKDGLYTARYTNRQGERKQKYFKKLQECRQWLADQQYKDEYDCAEAGEDMTANAWYKYWMEEVKSLNVKWGTLESYDEMYRTHMQGILGEMKMSKILPIHCQNVLNAMSNSKKRKYKKSTIKKVRTFMKAFFSDAVEYQIIKSNPVTKRVYCKKGAESTERKPLTREEQILFLQAMKGYLYYNPFALILQTGLRYSELTGLQWNDVDFEKRIIHVRRTLRYDTKTQGWRWGSTKSKSGTRDIPMTEEAYNILENQREQKNKVISLEFANLVFFNRKGNPTLFSAYNGKLSEIADKLSIQKFSIHSLRHTFATRCIEGGMRPKTLQKILGHSTLAITMDRYVHVVEDEQQKEMESIQSYLKVVG